MSERFPVKWFTSDMPGAPSTSGSGSIFDVLKKTLIEGFGLTAIDSITYNAETGLAVATINTGHSYKLNSVIQIAGVNDDAYNGEHRIVDVTNTTLSFKPMSSPAGTVATGETITIRVPPVGGWQVLHEKLEGLDTISMIIGSMNPQSGPGALKITRHATDYVVNVKLVYGATSIDEHNDRSLNLFADSFKNNDWSVVADDRLFYISRAECTWIFGDINSIIEGDKDCSILSCYGVSSSTASSSNSSSYAGSSSSYVHYPVDEASSSIGVVGASPWIQISWCNAISKNFNGGPDLTNACIFFPFLNEGSLIGFPNPVDGRVYVDMNPLSVNEKLEGGGNYGLRGHLPGIYPTRHKGNVAHGVHLHNLPGHDGKAFRLISLKRIAPYRDTDENNYHPVMSAAIDVIGPWR